MLNINRRYEYSEVERVTLDSGFRYYVCPQTGRHLPSVTTILDHTSDKEFLKEWKAWVGEAKAERIRDEAAQLGTLMHTHLECYVEGIERPRGNNLVRQKARAMADKIIEEGLCDVDEVWGQEIPLYMPGLYAGTADLVGVYKGKQAIMDHKNARKMRKRSMIENYRDQLSAYAMAHDELHGTNIECVVVFMCARDLSYQTFVYEGDEFMDGKASFLDRCEKYFANNPA